MKLYRRIAVLAAMVGASTAQAQHQPKHEFGIDLAVVSLKQSAEDVPSSFFPRVLLVNAPVDIRFGFISQGHFGLETRFGFAYTKIGDTDSETGGSALSFTPGLNILYRLGGGSGLHNQMGPYLTVGGMADIERASDEDGNVTESQFGVNVGLGLRKSVGSAAIRPEIFFAKIFETDDTAGGMAFGLRLGLSFFH